MNTHSDDRKAIPNPGREDFKTIKSSLLGNVERICKEKNITLPSVLGVEIFELVNKDASITEVCVVDEKKKVIGVLTRAALFVAFGGRYGFDLNIKRHAGELMSTDFLSVGAEISIEEVSKMALSRTPDKLYDAVIVTKDSKYFGVVSVKDLLEAAIEIQIKRAVDVNPLTCLPGNKTIEEKVKECIRSKKPFSAIYIDLDNFKAYNDFYGFQNGDLMLKAVADCMNRCFQDNALKCHIGGDDFVIFTNHWEVESLCKQMIDCFYHTIKPLYSENDWDNGYIISRNRHGIEEQFSIVTLSISVITNRQKNYLTVDEFSKEIAYLKKICKQKSGNCVEIR